MASMLYKWLIVFLLAGFNGSHHPVFVSVTEIEHNANNKTLEISCKIFTDDFEHTLRKINNTRVDLLDAKIKPAMAKLVNEYVQKHLQIKADGKPAPLQFIGFEQQEEGIVSFYEATNIATVKKLEVTNTILYESKPQQMQIIHVTINGERKSSRLNNPEAVAGFGF